MKRGEVAVEPFQDRFAELITCGETPSVIARRLDYVRGDGSADSTRLRRDLGLAARRARGYSYVQQSLSLAKAERFCAAMNLDPVDVGL